MALDYQTLIDTARPTVGSCNVTGNVLLRIALLVKIANIVAPSMNTDFQSLLSIAQVPGYRSASNASLSDLLELALLNIIAGGVSGGGGGGGSGQIKSYTADPNLEGVVPDDQTKPATSYSLSGAGPIFGWNTVTLVWN